MERHASRLVGVVALISAIVASTFATRSAAGADASGYLSQADLWFPTLPALYVDSLAEQEPELHGWLTTPLGWRPHEGVFCKINCEWFQSPTYPPGLPVLMAVPHAYAGINGAAAVVIASAAIAVWATGMIAGGVAGIVAAAFLAFSPVFLYQSFQPMSDVPVTAAWTLCFLLVRQRSMWAGTACAIAVLIRPNLAPLALIPLFVTKQRVKFAIPIMLAAVFLAFVQWFWYGSALRSGYGAAEELFALANIGPNALRYFNWMIATAPVLFFAAFGFVRLKHHSHARAMIVFAALVIASYLAYAVFDEWSYLRFLLPAMAIFAIFAAIELAAWIERWPVAARFPIFFALTVGVTAYGLFVARTFDTFKLREQLRRVEQVAEAINHTAPPNAVIIAGEQSGSMRYYTDRSILRWDAATPETLSKAIEIILKAGRPMYIVLDAWEMERFRAKFPDVGPAELDWPPMLEAGTSHRTLAWNLADRFRFQTGQRINTVRTP